MAHEPSPAFQFYPKDFLTDGKVAAMSLEECGAYIRLLCLCWQERSLPVDLTKLARMVGVTPRAFRRVWPAIGACFTKQGGRLIHRRLDKERAKQAEFRRRQSDAGKASAAARAAGNAGSTAVQPDPVQPEPQPEPNSPISDLRSPVSDLLSPISGLRSANPDLYLQPPVDRSQQRGTSTIRRAHTTALAGFERFWSVYPRKVGKDAARRVWQKRQPNAVLTDRIVAAVDQQTAWPEWTKDGGRFIPHPSTWLNRGSWDDEPLERRGPAMSDTTRANLAARESLLERVKESA